MTHASPAPWQSLLSGDGTAGWQSGQPSFSRDGQVITGQDGGGGDRFMTGEETWRDYAFAADVTPLQGPLVQLHYRISHGGKLWYTLDLRPDQGQVTISGADQREGRNIFAAVVTRPMAIQYGSEYALEVIVRNSRVTAFVNGIEIGRYPRLESEAGTVGLGLYASRAQFRNPRIRHLVS